MWVPINSGNGSENCRFRIAQVVRRHSESGILHSENQFLNSESCSENTPKLSQSSENGLFAPRAFFPKIGVVPRLLILRPQIKKAQNGHLREENRRLTEALGQERQGVRLVGGTRLVVFPRPNRPQFEKATCLFPFPCFFHFAIFLAFLHVYALFSKDFKGTPRCGSGPKCRLEGPPPPPPRPSTPPPPAWAGPSRSIVKRAKGGRGKREGEGGERRALA